MTSVVRRPESLVNRERCGEQAGSAGCAGSPCDGPVGTEKPFENFVTALRDTARLKH